MSINAEMELRKLVQDQSLQVKVTFFVESVDFEVSNRGAEFDASDTIKRL